MFMQKIEAPRVTCDLFGVESGFYGNGNGGHIRGDKPRSATEAEARAYADFIRRKCDLPDLGKVALQHAGGHGRWSTSHFHYVGATYGEEISRGEYQEGAYSVLFPGANQMRATVTLETLDESGEVISSQTMPVEPKKGGVVWSRDDVRKAAGKVAKPAKTKRTPTRSRAAPTVDKRRRAILLALRLRAELRRARWALNQHNGMGALLKDELEASYAAQQELRAELASARQTPQNCAAPASAPDALATAPDAILSDLAAAEAMMRGEGYVAPCPVSMREAFRTLYSRTRRDKLEGAAIMDAACDLTGEPRETFKAPRAARLCTAAMRALETPEGLRYRLQRNVLNGWGARHGLRSPAMDSPRFEAWRRVSTRADALRKRLADAGRLEFDAGNWVVRVLPLPVTPEPAPISESGKPDPRDFDRESDYIRALAGGLCWFVGRWSKHTRRHYEFRFTPGEYDAHRKAWADAHSGNLPAPTVDEVGPTPTAIQRRGRTPAHERAIRRAWAERKARRDAQEVAQGYWQRWEEMQADRDRHAQETLNEIGGAMILRAKRRRAVLKARKATRSARYFIRQSGAHYDRAINAEHEAREALAAREDLKRVLADAEARLAAAEAENAQLWAEIETLTAPTEALAA